MSDLRKKEPVEIIVPAKTIFIGAIMFGLVFGVIGIAFRHYVAIGV